MTPRRLVLAVSSALAAALVLAGCTVGPGGAAPNATSDPSSGPGSAGSTEDQDDMDGALLDDGRMFAIVSWGSSTCLPQVDDVSAEGQRVSVTLVEPEGDGATEQACTADLAPRATVGALPDGVDPTKDVTLVVTYGDLIDEIDVDGDPAATATPVLLTWGSSSCAPVVESVEADGSTGTVTFVTDEAQVCTMDMAPRATVVEFAEDEVDDDAPFELTLVGAGLDGTVEVR
ncbi:unnamed protein product [Penicillium discolor]